MMDEPLCVEDDMLVLTHRTRQSLHRTIQVCSGLLVVSVVVVCVLTLLTHTNTHTTHTRLLVNTRQQQTSRNNNNNKPSSVITKEIKSRDLFISVKTTSKFHYTRLPVILKTWYTLAPDHITFFTDEGDETLGELLGERLVPTSCPPDHSRQALVCKMQREFNAFMETNKKWFCHFDDDQYVNVPALLSKLQEFPVDLPWYLGKPSIQKPLTILHRDNKENQKKIRFWFATGGAGFCLSRPLAEKILPFAGGDKFMAISEKLRLPDDVTMGYIVSMLADTELTRLEEFHSHLEPLWLVGNLEKQISFSYTRGNHRDNNIMEVGGFNHSQDPTRFLSIHCHLFPHTPWCP